VKLELRAMTNNHFDARQAGDDLFNHSIGEVFLLGIAAQILERHVDGSRQREPCVLGTRERTDMRRWAVTVACAFPRQSAGVDNEAAGRQTKMAASQD
jgi:hypothetical protein